MSVLSLRLQRVAGFLVACCAVAWSGSAHGQIGGGGLNTFGNTFFANNIGGVEVDAAGVVNTMATRWDAKDLKALKSAIDSTDPLFNGRGLKIRKVSLRGLWREMEAAAQEKRAVAPEVALMGGLQRIEYVFVDPATKDIVFAGPAEAWTVDPNGNVVGATTGAPVLRLEDFVVAMQTAENANRDEGISCSINPTNEASERLARLQDFIGQFDPSKVAQVEELGGPQVITLTGVPTDSRYSQILVAADYKMKRLSMGFEPAPVPNMPSYLELCSEKGRVRGSSSPRFWMECNYQPLAVSEDGLSWQLRGPGVKTLTEDGFIGKGGERQVSQRKDALAEKWAKTMTDEFESLAAREPIFRELRNLMDLSVVAALITKENLLAKAGIESLPIDDASKLAMPTYHVPQSVPTQCSFVQLAGAWLVTASGGVQVDSWAVVDNRSQADLAKERTEALAGNSANHWCWN